MDADIRKTDRSGAIHEAKGRCHRVPSGAVGGAEQTIGSWPDFLETLSVTLDPIVDIHSGVSLGLAATPAADARYGLRPLEHLEERAWRDGQLAALQRTILHRAAELSAQAALTPTPRLFVRLAPPIADNGCTHGANWAALLRSLDACDLGLGQFVLTMPEDRLSLRLHQETQRFLRSARERGALIGVTEFGAGGASLPILHFFQPDFVQLGAFFLHNLLREPRKKIFLRHLSHIAHLAGSLVIVRDLADRDLYFACRDAGCDLIRGPLVRGSAPLDGPPVGRYEQISTLAATERRAQEEWKSIADQIECIDPICTDASMEAVFDRFRRDKAATFFPVVDTSGAPLGLIREQELKEYAFSPYGRDLMHNPSYGRKPLHFLTRCPVADIHSRVEDVLEIFTADCGIEGILIAQDGFYAGFLSAAALLHLINEKNLAAARDENPLTRLPGNKAIQRFLAEAAEDRARPYCLIYFDFDFFKPFNDCYGFRQGDRAIQVFADLLRAHFQAEHGLVGHVGGDDFFAGFRDRDFKGIQGRLTVLLEEFRTQAAAFYDADTRRQGFYLGKDRQGHVCRLPLLTASAAVIELPSQRPENIGLDDIGALFGPLKKQAKGAETHIAAASPAAASRAA